jgi:hypothetical protein
MSKLSGYRWGSVANMIGAEVTGSSVDWFYMEGKKLGINTCSMALETGTSKKPPRKQIKSETDRVYNALLNFISNGPTQ